MLFRTHRRRQPAGGPAGSAPRAPRCAGTTASAARPSRSDQDAAAPDSGGAGPGLCPEWPSARCARIFRMTAGSCRVAIRRRRPPQWAHANTSIPNAPVHQGTAQLQARGLAVFTPEHSDGADPRGLLPRAGRRRSPPRSGGQNRGDPAEASGTVMCLCSRRACGVNLIRKDR